MSMGAHVSGCYFVHTSYDYTNSYLTVVRIFIHTLIDAFCLLTYLFLIKVTISNCIMHLQVMTPFHRIISVLCKLASVKVK